MQVEIQSGMSQRKRAYSPSSAASGCVCGRLASLVGVRYPPILYLVGCIFVLILMIIHLAFRVSLIDERCRRMAQEMAMLHLHHAEASGTDTSVQRTPLSGSS